VQYGKYNNNNSKATREFTVTERPVDGWWKFAAELQDLPKMKKDCHVASPCMLLVRLPFMSGCS